MGETSFLKRDLVIFRGTYEECMNQPTEDMKIYLAWDTQEIYVGNRRGKKVQYGISKSIINELDARFKEAQKNVEEYASEFMNKTIEEVLDSRFDDLKREILVELERDFEENVENSEAVTNLSEMISRLNERVDSNKKEISNKLEEQKTNFENEISSVQNDINNLETRVNEEIKNVDTLKVDVERNTENISSINSTLENIYDKATVDRKDSETLLAAKQYSDTKINELDDTVRLITENRETLERILADDGVISELSNHTERITTLETKTNTLSNSINTNKNEIASLKSALDTNTTEVNNIKENFATRDFVNSSINAMAAEYITNSEGKAFRTNADLLSGPWYRKTVNVGKTGLLNHDYAIVLNDETQTDEYGKSGPTCRYTFSKNETNPEESQWQFQYRINETPFTSDQLNAIDSGMTREKVSKINDIDSTVKDLKNNTYTKEETFSQNEINSMISSIREIPEYTSADYGKILGVDALGNLTWVKASIGSETVIKTKVNTTLSISIDQTRVAISGTPLVLTVNGTAVNNSNGCAVDGNISISENGLPIFFGAAPQGKSEVKHLQTTRNLDISSVNTFTYKILGTKKADTENTEYTISGNNSSATLSVYQPTLFGYGDDINLYSNFDSNSTKLSIEGMYGERLYLYTEREISGITMNGFEYSYDYLGTSNISINGTNAVYHKYDLQTIYDTGTVSITISY